MLLSILKALLKAYDNTIKEINKEVVEEKNDDDTLRNKVEEKLKYATDKADLYIFETALSMKYTNPTQLDKQMSL